MPIISQKHKIFGSVLEWTGNGLVSFAPSSLSPISETALTSSDRGYTQPLHGACLLSSSLITQVYCGAVWWHMVINFPVTIRLGLFCWFFGGGRNPLNLLFIFFISKALHYRDFLCCSSCILSISLYLSRPVQSFLSLIFIFLCKSSQIALTSDKWRMCVVPPKKIVFLWISVFSFW